MNLFDIEQWRARRSLFADGDGAAGAGGAGAAAGAAADGAAAAGAASGAAGAEGAKAGAAAAGAGAGAEGAKAGGAAAAADWRTGITDPDGKKFAESSTDLNHLVGRALDMRKKLGSAIIPPGKDAKPEEIAAYRQKIGVPDKPDEYLKLFPQPEAGKELSPEVVKVRGQWAERFHAANVPAETAAQLVKSFAEDAKAKDQAIADADKRALQEAETALKQEWGAEYPTNRAYAAKAAQEVFGADFATVNAMTDKNDRLILDNPAFVKMFAKIGREMGEDRLGGAINEGDRKTIDQEITALRTQQAEAQARGDSRKANELYQQEQTLIAKLSGNKPIVGARGRAA